MYGYISPKKLWFYLNLIVVFLKDPFLALGQVLQKHYNIHKVAHCACFYLFSPGLL